MTTKRVCAIAAMDEQRVIGYKNGLPWKIKEDMERFKALTVGHTVMMGRKTFESLPDKYRPLPDRKNIVISQDPNLEHKIGVLVFNDPLSCIKNFRKGLIDTPSNMLWIIGGESIYRVTKSEWDEVYLTLVQGEHEGDAFFPEFEDEFIQIENEFQPMCNFLMYKRLMQ